MQKIAKIVERGLLHPSAASSSGHIYNTVGKSIIQYQNQESDIGVTCVSLYVTLSHVEVSTVITTTIKIQNYSVTTKISLYYIPL